MLNWNFRDPKKKKRDKGMSKKLKAIFLGILTICVSFISCFNVYANDKPIYLALGDSITFGYEPSDEILEGYNYTGKQLTDECFVQILAKEKGYEAINKGVVGNTAVGIKSQLDSGELDSYIDQAQVVTITCGGNDLMGLVYSKTADLYNQYYGASGTLSSDDVVSILSGFKEFDQSKYQLLQLAALTVIGKMDTDKIYIADFDNAVNDFISNLNQVTSYIKEKNPNASIFVETQYNPYEHFTYWKSISKHIGNCAVKLNDALKNNAKEGQYTIVDVYSAFEGNTETYCNARGSSKDDLFLDFHPSVEGYKVIAQCFSEVVPEAAVGISSIFGLGNAKVVGIIILMIVFCCAVFYMMKKNRRKV